MTRERAITRERAGGGASIAQVAKVLVSHVQSMRCLAKNAAAPAASVRAGSCGSVDAEQTTTGIGAVAAVG